MISASLVKELRESTGAGMLDCKKALEATNGDIDAAVDWLREKGISKAAKKADRIAAEGVAAIVTEGNVAAIVETQSSSFNPSAIIVEIIFDVSVDKILALTPLPRPSAKTITWELSPWFTIST